MKLNKFLKILMVIFETSTIGSIILYVYNYYISSKKYEIIPEAVKTRLNIFMIIAIISLILFLIIKYVLYIRNKTQGDEVSKTDYNDKISDNVVERVIIHKDAYDVPKERRMICPNCGNVIDNNAFICLKCGVLLKEIKQEKVIEKHIYNKEPNISIDKNKLKNLLINIGLGIAIIVCIILIISIAVERGIIG